jgi:DNA-binding PadR family transcriptional regulator
MDFTADFPGYRRRAGRAFGREQALRDAHEGRGGRRGGRREHRGGRGWDGGFGRFGPDFLRDFGGGFGGFPFGQRPRRGSRASRGDIRLAILALLSEQAMHGYQLMREIGTRSEGLWRPSPGAIYPALAQLEDEGLVEPESGGGKRVFRLTADGTRYVEEHRQEIDAVWDSVESDLTDDWYELANTGRQIMQAFFQVVSAGNRRQIAEATELMADTRRKLYRILSEDETADAADGPVDDVPEDDEPGD